MATKRNFGLDLCRASAITGVFLGHAVSIFSRLLTFLDLFFVLSGFLIGRVYFRSVQDGTFTFLNFWTSRWWRTLPPYLAALGIYVLSRLWDPRNVPISWHYLFFLQNITWEEGFPQSWSLCVEEHFYIALPILALVGMKLFGRHSPLWTLPILFLLPSCAIALLIQHHGGIAHVPVPWRELKWTPFSAQPLIAGVWLAYLYVEKPDWFRQARTPSVYLAVILLPIIFLMPGSGGPAWLVTTYSLIKAIGFAALLRIAFDLQWNPVTSLGQAAKTLVRATAITSYSIYLMHTLLMYTAGRYVLLWHKSPQKTLFMIVAMALPCLPFYFLFEKPSIVSRDRFMKRKARPEPMTV